MSITSPSYVRRHKALLAAVAIITGVLGTATTAVGASASARSASSVEIAFKKKPEPKPKPKPKPKKKTTPTTVPSTTPVTDLTPPKASVGITEEGSTLLLPLFELWSDAYHQQYGNIDLTPGGGGSGKGVSDAANGVINIGASDAYLSSAQVSQYPGLKNIALAISAQMVNYNIPFLKPAGVHLVLSGSVLSQIFQGKITEWNDPAITALNPNAIIPSLPIVTLHRSDSSGDTFIFSSFLSAADPNGWGNNIGYGTSISFPAIPNALGENGNGGMVTGCQATAGCIAYIGISYLQKTQAAGLGEAELVNASGNAELPTAATISAESQELAASTPANETLSMIYDKAPSGYPIVNYEYGIIPPKEPDANTAAAVRAFLYWAIDPAKGSSPSFLDQVNFQPLPTEVADLSDKQIASITN
ncbi:MAG: phosphate ABC transporter substrate-binding protein PstS [Acidimicrobiales bacterium]